MARSVWKGPYFDITLYKKVKKSKEENSKSPIKTWSRRSTIIPDFVGVTLSVYNGKSFIPVFVTEDMVGHKLGEFSPTRVFKGHSGDKKAVQLLGSFGIRQLESDPPGGEPPSHDENHLGRYCPGVGC
jgi:small subunit ribosomal protein S19